MTVIGVLLILVAVVLLLIGLLAGADTSTTLSIGGVDISMSAMGVFLMGAATVLIFVSGLELLRSGLRRSLRRRRELKEARAVVAEQERRGQDTGAQPATAGGAAGATAESAPATETGTTETGTTETGATETGATGTTSTTGTTSATETGAPGAKGTPGTTPDASDDPGRHAR